MAAAGAGTARTSAFLGFTHGKTNVLSSIYINITIILPKLWQNYKRGLLVHDQVDDFAWHIDSFDDLLIADVYFDLFVLLGCRNSIFFAYIARDRNLATDFTIHLHCDGHRVLDQIFFLP